jgi:hypothetical protein
MEYSIKILQENLDRLNSRYEKFVSNGSVEITSIIALDNRKKARDLEQAITEINQSLQLQQTGVSTCFLEDVTDDVFNMRYKQVSCCKIAPITEENYCPNCGNKILK